jgi:hypothetical protein
MVCGIYTYIYSLCYVRMLKKKVSKEDVKNKKGSIKILG